MKAKIDSYLTKAGDKFFMVVDGKIYDVGVVFIGFVEAKGVSSTDTILRLKIVKKFFDKSREFRLEDKVKGVNYDLDLDEVNYLYEYKNLDSGDMREIIKFAFRIETRNEAT
jgi:hypothetical protein